MLRGIADLAMLTWARVTGPALCKLDVVSAHEPACRAALVDLLSRHSHQAGQFHALSRDPWKIIWSPGRRAFLPFHEKTFSLIAWRDPVAGDARDASDVMHLFRAYASSVGKHAFVLGAGEELRTRSAAFGSIWIGAEQHFDLGGFSTRGKAGEKLRLAMNHARRCGARAREIFPNADPWDRARLLALEESWKEARSARRNNSFLRTDPLENGIHRRYFAVETESASGLVMQSFLVCSPVSDRGFYLQDLVRAPDAPRGVSELVTIAALETFRAEGLSHATAGLVPFFDPLGIRARTPRSKVVATCIRHFDRMYRFSGLQQFRGKFAMATVEPAYVLHWPTALTPLAVWDVASLLSGTRASHAECK